MIEVAEALVDPVAFVKENHAALNLADDSWGEVVSGQDFDVRVKLSERAPPRLRRREKIVSPVLGELYMRGEAFAVPVGEQHANLTWFPSPPYVNEMLGSLGLEPGENVLSFTHANGDKLKAVEYASHLARGEYPQSTGLDFFKHDRIDDHAIAVILAPEIFTRGVIAVAQEHIGYDELPDISKNLPKTNIAVEFDHMTFGVRHLIRDIWPQVLAGASTPELDLSDNDMNWYGSPFDDQTQARYMRVLWGMDRQTSCSRERTWQHVADLVFERLSELAPAIAELQKQTT